jgi:hypothetical protein
MLRFTLALELEPIPGRLLYRMGDHAVDFQADHPSELQYQIGSAGVTSLSIGTLQLEIAIASGRLLYPWGYLPLESLKRRSLKRIDAVAGAIRVDVSRPLVAGVSIAHGVDWTACHDPESGLIQLEGSDNRYDTAINFCAQSTACMMGDRLVAVQLLPAKSFS